MARPIVADLGEEAWVAWCGDLIKTFEVSMLWFAPIFHVHRKFEGKAVLGDAICNVDVQGPTDKESGQMP